MLDLHPSLQRLIDCARSATEAKPAPQQVRTRQQLQSRLGISSQTYHNWGKRGVSKEGALAAEAAFGCAAGWILDGRGPNWKYQQTANQGSSSAALAQELSLHNLTVAPPQMAWEQLMTTRLPAEFQTTAPDQSMAPDVPRGARIILISGVQPEPGDFVLVADAAGVPYLREYKQLRQGHWQAHARNPAFLPLDSHRDGLRVLAVFDGIRGRRSGA